MLSKFLSLAVFSAAVTARPTYDNNYNNNELDPSKWPSQHVIHKDVAIIGGGSAGTYAAISLKDKKISSIVIEAKGRTGGHAVTYTDPATGIPIDYGVLVLHNEDLVKNYFKRFNIPLTPINPAVTKTGMFDFKTGKPVIPAKIYSTEEIADAMKKYAGFIAQWPQLNEGLFLPDPVPDVLAQPLGEVAKKYGFEAAIPTFYNYNPGLGDELTLPVVELMRVFNLDLLQTFATSFYTPANHNISSLYAASQAELLAANSLLLNSWAVQTKRTDSGVNVVVKTPTGEKLVVAKKLLITVAPKVDYLKQFDLSAPEADVFAKFLNGAYYTSVVKNSGLPVNLTVFNGQQNTPFNFGPLPGIINSNYIPGSDLRTVYYAGARTKSSHPYNPDTIKSEIIAGLKAMQSSSATKVEPEIVAFSDHAPFYLQACASDIKKGFYKQLYALQGLRSTFYSGATWKGHDSSQIWKYTENTVIPQIVKSLQK